MVSPTVIAPVGELDIATVADFRAAMADAARAASRIVIDLSQVNFIDSSGLAAVLETWSRLRRDTSKFALVVPGGTAPAVALSLSGLRHTLPVFESVQAALAA
jgi:anti-sigma B factor antagonist